MTDRIDIEAASAEKTPSRQERIAGALLGTALGDALGLPFEGLSAERVQSLDWSLDRFHLVGRRGFVSDDTEQTALVAEAVVKGDGNLDATVAYFRRSLVGWFWRLPFGIGWSTLRACLRATFGRKTSGVASAGNGSAMRSGIIGVATEAPDERARLARALSAVTHTDPRAVEASVFVAELASLCAEAMDASQRIQLVRQALAPVQSDAVASAVRMALDVAAEGKSPTEAAMVLGNTGYVIHSAAISTYAFAAGGEDPLHAIQTAILAGGDTDTHAAIVGGWVGALHGVEQLPADLVAQLADGPFGRSHLNGLADSLATGAPLPRWSAARAMLRNLALYPVVLGHGFARILRWKPKTQRSEAERP